MITIKEVAVLAETSVATVSRVLNGSEHVSEATRRRVLEAVAASGYVPQKSQRPAGTADEILVILPTLNNPYFQEILRGIEQKASSCGYQTWSCVAHRDPETESRYLRSVLSGRAQGVILVASSLSDAELDALSLQVPAVLCGSPYQVQNASVVCIDDRQAAFDAVTALIRMGHKRIAMISYEQEQLAFVKNRRLGYRQALETAGLAYDPSLELSSDNSYEDGYECSRRLLEAEDPPTAVFTFSEMTGIGILRCLSEKGLTAGKDVDVMGFDGTPLGEYCHPALSVAAQPAYSMGRLSFEILYDQIASPDDYVRRRVILSHRLILRETTRQPAPGRTADAPEA